MNEGQDAERVTDGRWEAIQQIRRERQAWALRVDPAAVAAYDADQRARRATEAAAREQRA